MIWEWEKVGAEGIRFQHLPSAEPPTADEIAHAAYLRSQNTPGSPQEHWLATEKDLRAQRAAASTAPTFLGGTPLPAAKPPPGVVRGMVMPALSAAAAGVQPALRAAAARVQPALSAVGLMKRTPEQDKAHWNRMMERGQNLEFREQARAEATPSNVGLTPRNIRRGGQAFVEGVVKPTISGTASVAKPVGTYLYRDLKQTGQDLAKIPGAIAGEGARVGSNFMKGWNWARGTRG